MLQRKEKKVWEIKITPLFVNAHLRRLQPFDERNVAENVVRGICEPLQQVVFQLHQLDFVLQKKKYRGRERQERETLGG